VTRLAGASAEWPLAGRLVGIRVAGLHVAYMDTDMTQAVTARKSAPADVARLAADGIGAGAYEILADDTSRRLQSGLAAGVAELYPQLP
jgi:hypothetical protein